jgi:DNA repair protein SbcC/Rad50
MIPVSLTLNNFLSYGEDAPTLDFTAFQIACITGRNGHGKSALFDAITWALWGEARKASSDRKPDEGLLRLGATDLRVEFVFDLESQRFRVTRAYRKTARSGSSSLELQVLDPETDRYRSLSESSSIRKTQTRIDKLIRISYDTFVNSAFILQGRVDEFTRRSPSDRKAILSDILELSRYDALAARARDHARQSESTATRVRDTLTRIDEAAEKCHALKEQLTEARSTLEQAEKASEVIERDLEACNSRIARAEADRAQRTALIVELDGQRLLKEELGSEITAAAQAAADNQTILDSSERVKADVERLTDLRKEDSELRAKQTARQALQLEQARIEAEVAAARAKVETRQQHWQSVVTELEELVKEAAKAMEQKPKVDGALRELAELRKQESAVIALRDQRDKVEVRRREVETEFNKQRSEIQIQIESGQTRRRELQALLDRRTALERTFNDARQHLETFGALNGEMERVKREGTEAQQTEDRLLERIEGLGQRRQQLVAQTTQLENPDNPDCPLCGTELDETHRDEVLEQFGKDASELAWQHETATRDLSTAKERRDTCRAAYQKLRDQVHPLADAPRQHAQAEAELAQVSTVSEDLETLVGKLQNLEDEAKQFETSSPQAIELKQLRTEIETLARETGRHEEVRSRIETLSSAEIEKARLDELQARVDDATNQLPEAKEKHLTATQWIEEERYAPDLQEKTKTILAEVEDLGYDERKHTGILTDIEALKDAEERLSALRNAERDLAIAQARVEATKTRGIEIDARLASTEEALAKYADLDKDCVLLDEQKQSLVERQNVQRSTRDTALKLVAALERDEEACLDLISQRPDTVKDLMAQEKDTQLYRELVKAFGRDGIQALLIDQAIPELQDEANRILSRLTANGTQITLESLGELKGGGTKETLDIRISDELGERRYELYSGGEAFRVDFAIRIALSKLLANRSGTPLQTLVIDEGFGTQDEQGLAHLIEAIQTISDEFEKVLVITHVEAIKNAFPVRVEVVKHPESGSTFSVVS